MSRAYDYVIVGGGPAGCVVAHRLSADPAASVLLLEAGGDRASRLRRALARLRSGFDASLRWQYETIPQEAMVGRRLYLPQGRALGGGSAINAMTYVRGQPSDYATWQRLGNEGWGWERVLAAFKRLEHNQRIVDSFHGQGGPLYVTDPVRPHRLTRVFVEAGEQAGLRPSRDFNGAIQDGVGIYQLTQVDGSRWTAADAFLGPAAGRSNLTILTGAYATRLLVTSGRAVGVELVRDGRTETMHAEAEVVVSGGAINSPKLLLLSGIGQGDDLRRLGISVVHDLPGVGQNLQDHLRVQVITRSTEPDTYDDWDRPLSFLRAGLEFLIFNTGVATSNLAEGGGFFRSSTDVPSPDVQLHFLPLLWLDHGRRRIDGHGMTLEASCLRPESRGCVRLASADPAAPPLIDPRYCTEAADLRVLVAALRRSREIMQARAFRPSTAEELFPGPDRQSDRDLADYVRECAITNYHPAGTCRMGVDDLAVVDPQLRVRGLASLRVIDSSIMPAIVSGSTQAPSMMIGEIGAAMITR